VALIKTDNSEERIITIMGGKIQRAMNNSPKRQFLQSPRDITSQKAAFFKHILNDISGDGEM
jgi:hypothetical protein